MKTKLLFLSAFLPSPHAVQAGQKIAFHHLECLAEKYDIWFVGFRNEVDHPDDAERLQRLCRECLIYPMDWVRRVSGALLRPSLPVLISSRWRPGVANDIARLVRTVPFERVHCEWSQMAEYLPLTQSVPERFLVIHDVVTQFCDSAATSTSGLRKLFWSWERSRALRWERSRYRAATALVTLSRKDEILLRATLPELGPRLRSILPFFDRYSGRVRSNRTAPFVLLFWGSLSRVENVEAALWLARSLMPALRHRCPDLKLILAGANPPARLQECACSDIVVTGFLSAPQKVFDEATVAVLPLFRGAGVKIKVLECLAAGLPVLTTSIGAEGIIAVEADGLTVLEADPETYATRLVDWWQTNSRIEQLSDSALQWSRSLPPLNRSILLHA